MFSESRLTKWMYLFWGLVLLTLPVTSFRYFPSFMGRVTVRPLALYPLAILLVVLFIFLLKRKELPLPSQIVPLAAFLLFALFATMIGSTYAPLDLGNVSYWSRALRAWVTVGTGLLFFFGAFMASYYLRSFEKPLKWLYVGLALTIVWSGIQAVAIYTDFISRDLIDSIQLSFSLRPLLTKRVSGFAFEPAWLADTLMVLYFSWLAGSILTGYRVSRYVWLEPVLLLGGLGILLATLSRGGLLNVIVSGTVVILVAGLPRIRSAYEWFMAPFRNQVQGGKWLRFGIVISIVFMVAVGGWFLNNSYSFSQLWIGDIQGGLVEYLLDNRVGSRLAYLFSSFETYSLHPWTGVGLGGSGFYMLDLYPDWAVSDPTVEIATQLGERFRVFPNPKNMYVRLLAETGVVGFWLFMTFLLSVLGRIVYRLKAADLTSKFIGTSGLFAWVAVLMVYITQDSFASPLTWVVFGMILGFDQAESLELKKEDG